MIDIAERNGSGQIEARVELIVVLREEVLQRELIVSPPVMAMFRKSKIGPDVAKPTSETNSRLGASAKPAGLTSRAE